MIGPIGPIFQPTSEEIKNETPEIKEPETSNRDVKKDWDTVRKGGSLKEEPKSKTPELENNWMNIVPESNRQVLDFSTVS